MSKGRVLANGLLCAAICAIPIVAQGTTEEIRPELGFYIQQSPLVRFALIDDFIGNQSTYAWQGHFGFYAESALKPVVRRELRGRPDVYRNKYLTFRAGYRYQNSLTNGYSAAENRGILELTPRYELPSQLVLIDRNQGEFRFIQGKPFTTRYRNRIRLERDLIHGWLDCTPYIYDEIFYDPRFNTWAPNRYGFGVQVLLNRRMVLEPYYFHQPESRPVPATVNAFGVKLNLYFLRHV